MTNIGELYKIFCENPIITTDSRNISKGSIFFAIKGPHFDGNDFASEAIKKGAAYAVIDKPVNFKSQQLIKVNDSLTVLQQLAGYHRKILGAKILAITGSNGKTTTKELCKWVLQKKYNVFATAGNLNNHLGVPLSLLSLTKETDIGIIEMGANHPGEIAGLCNIAMPDYGLITNIGKAHLEGFGGIEGVKAAKGELFAHLIKNGKTIFVNNGNEYVRSVAQKNYEKRVDYNNDKLYGEFITCEPFLKVKVVCYNEEIIINTKLVGKYNIENVVAATAVGQFFHVPAPLIKEAIEDYVPDNFRSQFIDTGKNKVIMDAYNANPSSMKTAIENFMEIEADSKLLILGEMLELGEASENEHKKIINLLHDKKAGEVILVGDAFSQLTDRRFRFFSSIDELIKNISPGEIKSKYILIKGSRGNRLERLLALL
ncbi:MAG: UDP-N-acetylmuramoyl-tripeptide--D-alanyl-D-alanine ligase [Bacteroidales bacterium]|nr:UDP-N-acetylmuramoyl-tripeptide--D-alanyl-D-alanine ligase [Bacteroidales bacterium]